MERSIYNKLVEWKNKRNHKPLILNGARQVGKTYILQEFGKREYKKLAFFSLDRNQKAAEVFEKGGTTADILMALSAISQVDITPNDTLMVLDEIQDCPKALEALKFFCEDAPDIHIIVAGSLLGISQRRKLERHQFTGNRIDQPAATILLCRRNASRRTRPCRAEGTAGSPFHPKADYTRLSPRFLEARTR